jgi:uncharacterized membrane protein
VATKRPLPAPASPPQAKSPVSAATQQAIPTGIPQIQATILAQTQQWSGPLPPPGALQQFNEIIPNGAERIMSMVEQEQAHRLAHENARQEGEINATRRGHYIGGAITLLSIAAAVGGGYLGVHPAICVAVVGLPIATVIKSIFGKSEK